MNVFVAFFVLLLLLAESTPKAAESVPLIGIIIKIKNLKKEENWTFQNKIYSVDENKKKNQQQPSNVFAYYRNLLLSEHDNDYTFYNFGCHRNKHVLPRCSN